MKLTGKELLAQGFVPGPAIGLLVRAGVDAPVEELHDLLSALRLDPSTYLADPQWGE
jgi:hypothetical protein